MPCAVLGVSIEFLYDKTIWTFWKERQTQGLWRSGHATQRIPDRCGKNQADLVVLGELERALPDAAAVQPGEGLEQLQHETLVVRGQVRRHACTCRHMPPAQH